ncbi:extensin-like [Actinia tenebrosa]|uniref:Extensin-like n=1 Tax=Actinia tenebrosa TaxID=6105 RepID=A0A6P8HSI8_ACTTE|nr:extensin-like [Actinia tenebrosa]
MPSPSFTTPENVPSTSLPSDSGYVTPKPKTPSFLERLTSKIRTPSFEPSRARSSTLTEVPPTPLKPTTSFDQPSPTASFSTPKAQTLPPPPYFLPTPPPSKEKPVKWISYQNAHKYKDVVKPPRRSERLRAIAKWENF